MKEKVTEMLDRLSHLFPRTFEESKKSREESPKKYWQTKGYLIFGGVVALVNIAAWLGNLWLYAYISSSFLYIALQAVLEKSGLFVTFISLVIPPGVTVWLSSRKNKKGFQVKDLGVYGGTLAAIFLVFCWLELMTYNSLRGIETDDYLYRLSEANNNETRIPAVLLPVKTISIHTPKIEGNFEFDYHNDSYRLRLKAIEAPGTGIDAAQLTPGFLDRNKTQIIDLIVDKQISRGAVDAYLSSNRPLADYIREKKEDGSLSGSRWITGIILVDFIKSHWEWGIFQRWAKEAPEGGFYKKLIGWTAKHMGENGVRNNAL